MNTFLSALSIFYAKVSAVYDATSMKSTEKSFDHVCKKIDNINASQGIVGRPSNPPSCSGKVYCVTTDILNSAALFLFLDKDKKVLRFCKRVIGKF